MKKQKVTVIVNTYPRVGREVDLRNCLDSLIIQSWPDFEIVLVENNVDDKKIKYIRADYNKRLKIRLVICPTKRLSSLFNFGWKKATTEILAFLADDAAADKEWLKEIAGELTRSDHEVAAVSGPVISSCFPTGEMHALYLKMNSSVWGKIFIWPYIHFAMDDKPQLPGKYFESGAYSFGAALPEAIHFEKQKIDLLTTTSMGIKKKVLEEMNGFDERFCFNHADGDLFLRLKAAGYSLIFNPKVIAHHQVRIGPSRNAYYIGRDTGLFHKLHLRPKNWRFLVGAGLNIFVLNVYWLYAALTKKDWSQLKGISGYIKGVGQSL